MAVAATDITLRHFGVFDEEARQLLGSVRRLKESPHIHFISDVEDSIKLNRIKSGAVIISASGMCDAGRVLHHLKNNLSRPECAVVICGFQAEGSLGRRLVDGARQVRLLGDEVEVRAGIHTLGGFSAHADQQALLDWAAAFTRPPQQTFVVHGEPHASWPWPRCCTSACISRCRFRSRPGLRVLERAGSLRDAESSCARPVA
jgi:metallo-beta-lactamase family protein